MDTAAFLRLLRNRAGCSADIRDPVAAAKSFLLDDGETAQGKAFAEVLRALAGGTGQFSESTMWLFDMERLRLLSALIEARISSQYTREEWEVFR